MSAPPDNPKIYHIVHADKLPSIISDGYLWSDAEIQERAPPGTVIGMSSIKQRRLEELTLSTHPNLYVGQCVPFYFCPRSVMLYLIYVQSHELTYKGGQAPIVHLEIDLHAAVAWAEANQKRWAFSTSNAGSYFFEDRGSVEELDQIDWEAVRARQWSRCKEGKQAEFLVEDCLHWGLVSKIGVSSKSVYTECANSIQHSTHKPSLEIQSGWYY